jgi:ligand-binding sensor domain-containing protein
LFVVFGGKSKKIRVKSFLQSNATILSKCLSLIKTFLMKRLIIVLFSIHVFCSCHKSDIVLENDFSPSINFKVSEWVLKGINIQCVDFEKDGNIWIASGNKLIFYPKHGGEKEYDAGSQIRDFSIDPDGKIWLATKDKGLALFLNEKFIYYTMANAGLPRDLIITVEAAPDKTVWFSCSAHQLGGLMHFDGKKFELFTPENSILNQNLILDLKIDRDGNIFVTSEGTVKQAKVFKIDNKGIWKMLDDEVEFYWIAGIDVNSKSEVVLITDHSLSSCVGCYTDEVMIHQNGKWNKIERDFELHVFFRQMFVDKRDYIWVRGIVKENETGLFVYDGKKWYRPAKGQIPDSFINSVKVDDKNSIWFCTNEGIYILKQS